MSIEAQESNQLTDLLRDQSEILGSIRDILIAQGDPQKQAVSAGAGDKSTSMITKMMKSVGTSIKAAVGPMALLGDFLGAFLEPLELIIDPITMFGEQLSKVLYPILEPMADFLYDMDPYLDDIVNTYAVPVVTFLMNITGAFALLSGDSTSFELALEDLDTALKNAEEASKSWAASMRDDVIPTLQAWWQWLKDQNVEWENFFAAVKSSFTNIWDDIIAPIGEGAAKIVDAFVAGIIAAGDSVSKSIKEWVKDRWEDALNDIGIEQSGEAFDITDTSTWFD